MYVYDLVNLDRMRGLFRAPPSRPLGLIICMPPTSNHIISVFPQLLKKKSEKR